MKREIFSTMKAKKAAVQYGHPSRGARVIIVAGVDAAVTGRLLAELLRESGKRTAVFTTSGSQIENVPYTLDFQQAADSIQQALAAARKQRCEVVVMEMVGAVAKYQVLATLHLDMAVVTDDSVDSTSLLDQPLTHAVLPYGLSIENLPVAPHQLINVGENEAAEARVSDIKLYRKGTELTLTIDHQTVIDIASHLVGRASAISAAYAAAAGYVFGESVEVIAEGIARLETIPAYYQYLDHQASYQVVVDSTNDGERLSQLVDSAKQLTKRRLIVVVDKSVDSLAVERIKPVADRLIGLSGQSYALSDEAVDLTSAVAIAKRAAKKDDLVLLVGREFAKPTDTGVTLAEQLIKDKDGQ